MRVALLSAPSKRLHIVVLGMYISGGLIGCMRYRYIVIRLHALSYFTN